MHGFAKLLDFIYPPRCPVCDGFCEDGICPSCREKVIPVRDDFCLKCGKPLTDGTQEYCADCRGRKHFYEQGRSLFSYQGEIRLSLYRMKYGNRQEYAACYGREMARVLGPWIRRSRITRIVPIPLHPSRKRQRGYNQAALLARSLGKSLGIPVEEHLLYRVKRTGKQKTLSAQERRENLRGAFAVGNGISDGERILLVDDIYTTGSTVDAAAKCLKQAGNCCVCVVTVAIGG